MKPVFVDTSALIAIGNRKDSFHQQAIDIRNELRSSRKNFVTTNAVLFEFGNAFSKVYLRTVAVKIYRCDQNFAVRLLLDTHTFLWFTDGSPKLDAYARQNRPAKMIETVSLS